MTIALRRTVDLVRVVRLDPFVVMILATVAVAAMLPARGAAVPAVDAAATGGVAVLFWLYGLRLSPTDAWTGLRHWRLHLTVIVATFLLFPVLGMAARGLVGLGMLDPALYQGLLYLTLLPSTVQSSIAFTSVARGNVAAAVCSASLSNLVGVVLTPLLVALLLVGASGGFSASAVLDLVTTLIVPFALGQLCRPWLGNWVRRRAAILKVVDRGSILLVVYTAFGQGVREGIWSQITVGRLVLLVLACSVLLAVVMVATWAGSRRFERSDRIVVLFCGSKKSLAAGLPMASVLFAGHSVGLLVLPLMLFHQLQLLVCAAIAARMGARPDPEPATVPFTVPFTDLVTAPLPRWDHAPRDTRTAPRHARSVELRR